MKKVDTHAHVFTMNEGVVADARYSPGYSATVQQYIAHLDQHGLNYGVLIQPSFLGYDNSQMLKAIAAYPQRLKGIAVLPLDVDKATLLDLQDQGIVGIRLNLFGKPVPVLEQEQWQQFFAQIAPLGWQIELHCPPHYLVQLLPALLSYPGNIVLDHFARLDPEKGVQDPDFITILQHLKLARFWVKVSGFYRLGQGEQGKKQAHEAFALLMEHGLSDQLIWGSDWPHTQHESQISYDTTIRFFHEMVGDVHLREKILGTNALTLFDFAP